MAYISQDRKRMLSVKIKQVCKKYKVKATLAVRNHMTLVLNIKQGSIDFMDSFNRVVEKRPRPEHIPFRPATDYIQVNPYWYKEHFDGKALEFLKEVIVEMNVGNHDNSNSQIDYFDVGWYIDINIGRFNCPYILAK